MASTTLSVALALVVFASTVDCKPVVTSVPSVFCTVEMNTEARIVLCPDTKHKVEWTASRTADRFKWITILADKPSLDTRNITTMCRAESFEGQKVSCGDSHSIEWNRIENDGTSEAREHIRVKVRHTGACILYREIQNSTDVKEHWILSTASVQ